MSGLKSPYLRLVYETTLRRNPGESEFLQAAQEVLESIDLVIEDQPDFPRHAIVERLLEPERFVQFQVPWADDAGNTRVNRGYRVQFNSALGPYKGGLRFHPSVSPSVVKFLGFEQTFKNALTGLPLGGGKGGADFDPKGKSEGEIKRFCQSYMTELSRHLGQFTDIPAGDIGVGPREVGYMFGQHKRISNEFTGVFTGKLPANSGSLGRKEATGYGLLYILQEMFKSLRQEDLAGRTIAVSGSGNVAIYAIEKAAQLGAKVLTASDSGGYIHDAAGIDCKLLKQIKEVERGRITEYVKRVPTARYHEGAMGVWTVPCDIALPCATQNELDAQSARALVKNKVLAVAEGSNMAATPDAIEILQGAGVFYIPGKAANAGGVAVSGLEMSQNSLRLSWSFDEVDERLRAIMVNIFHSIRDAANQHGQAGNFVAGANIAGLMKVSRAMLWQG